jgi:hypothetical protein
MATEHNGQGKKCLRMSCFTTGIAGAANIGGVWELDNAPTMIVSPFTRMRIVSDSSSYV